MPEKRLHRGPHPEDHRLFAAEHWPRLRRAVAELSWLLGRGYTETASLKLVGDRHNLTARQRIAVRRCACSDAALASRHARERGPAAMAGQALIIDGFNLITTVEAALAGGVLIVGRDGCLRDMASMHGNYRKVAETRPAAERIGQTLAAFGAGDVTWLLDRPVSNSGRLKSVLLELAEQRAWAWQVELVDNPDAALIATTDALVVSADSAVLDACGPWLNFARLVVARCIPAANVVDLGGEEA